MVCAKCQKVLAKTELATPGVKRKNDIYYGSPTAAASTSGSGKSKTSATLGNAGISKSKLLSKSAKNPYAAYSSTCKTCKTKVDSGKTYCQKCAYKANACAMCGKNLAGKKETEGVPVVQGQKFSAK